ncbi:universal stress protein [Candidatus Nitronereus thalassa]|uniref:Universal stress protein n=1 Tax=Candidatus Nitronereus thalassa TaxID=3020898 RepID=A0ABU3K8W0_9BACT|nr:universal stress protein [Candidatus Nitronereus thalassa]MDT7042816.1 universal stress protein [Candidatus Nitronereus thalassa]
MTRFKKILVPVDFSSCSKEALHMAADLAALFDARLFLLHVIDTRPLENLRNMGLGSSNEEKAQMKKLRHFARLQARTLLQTPELRKLKIDRILSEGKPFVEIIRTARTEKVDLIVRGSYGGQTSDVGRIFFGSTAEQVVRTANCPVLCVPFLYKKPTGPKNVNPQKSKTKRSKMAQSS